MVIRRQVKAINQSSIHKIQRHTWRMQLKSIFYFQIIKLFNYLKIQKLNLPALAREKIRPMEPPNSGPSDREII
jgi:hypothetical protein